MCGAAESPFPNMLTTNRLIHTPSPQLVRVLRVLVVK